MKYTSRSTVSVTFRNLDHASAFHQFLCEALRIAGKGGDFGLAVVDWKREFFRHGIGHDVEGCEISHTMDVASARQEIGEAQASQQQLQSAIAKIKEAFSIVSQQTDM